MKIYTLIPLVILALVFVGGYFIVPAFEAPKSKLDRQIDEQVELAQRMLHAYNAATPRLAKAFEPAATRPAQVDADKWQNYVDMAESTPFGDEAFLSLRERMANQEQALQQAARTIGGLGGQETSVATPGPEEGYQQVLDELKAGHALLDEAARIVRGAIAMQEGQGENEVSGRDHPTATRLEAILLRHKADLLRREAAMVRAKANLDRKQVERLSAISRETQDGIAAQQMLLTGGTAPGKTKSVGGQDAVDAAPGPASESAAGDQPTADRTAAGETAAKPARSGGWWIFDPVAARIAAKPAETETADNDNVVEPAAPAAEPVETEPALAEAEPEIETGPAEAVPSLPERIANLTKTRTEVVERISAVKADVARLSKDIESLEARRDAAEESARQAQLKMFEAEQKGANASDPEAVQKFINEYRKLSDQHREAAREAAMLREGSVRNGRSASADPDEIMSSPIIAADESKPMEAERGLLAVTADKGVADKVLASSEELLAEIDRQLAGLNMRREAVEAQLSTLQASSRELAAQVAKYAASAVENVVRADALEQEAIAIAEGPGQQSAGRAQTAAGTYQRDLGTFIRSENPTEVPERKLTDMASDQFTVANAVALQADFNYLLARTYVQQATDLELHAQMLSALAAAGITVALDPERLPEGVEPDAAPAAATSADAAATAVTELRQKAAEAAKEALDQYSQAATQLKDLWVVHINIAAVHNLLANLPRVEGDTEDHLVAARQTYARAIQGREQRPEYAAYRRILDSLKETPTETN